MPRCGLLSTSEFGMCLATSKVHNDRKMRFDPCYKPGLVRSLWKLGRKMQNGQKWSFERMKCNGLFSVGYVGCHWFQHDEWIVEMQWLGIVLFWKFWKDLQSVFFERNSQGFSCCRIGCYLFIFDRKMKWSLLGFVPFEVWTRFLEMQHGKVS
jgi:hypothetical protein